MTLLIQIIFQWQKEQVEKLFVFLEKLINQKKFGLPNLKELEEKILKYKPTAILVIPYDNPTGQFFTIEDLIKISEIAVRHNLWIISDESYRELQYTQNEVSSIWKIDESLVQGIFGRRISIETSSKVWNACGLRIGGIITDNKEFHEKCVAENTANLCANVIGQYIFGALAHESKEDLQLWYEKQRNYYKEIAERIKKEFEDLIPNIILTSPDSSIYTVIDVKNIVDENFNSLDFVSYCAEKGSVEIEGKKYTLLVSPMTGFYSNPEGGRTQMRIAYVEVLEKMKLVPRIFKELLEEYIKKSK